MHTHSFTVKLFTLLTARHNCVDELENKTITMEYNYYPGYYLSPSTMLLTWPRIGEGEVEEGWEVARCGKEEMCLNSLKGPLEVESKSGKQNRLPVKTDPEKKILDEEVNWNMRFEVMCEDCEAREHCFIVNRFEGGNEEEARGRMMADHRGRVNFGYNYAGSSYQEWFDWKIKILH